MTKETKTILHPSLHVFIAEILEAHDEGYHFESLPTTFGFKYEAIMVKDVEGTPTTPTEEPITPKTRRKRGYDI